jgi:hypothetical protein
MGYIITAIRDLFNSVDLDDWRVKRRRLIRGLLYIFANELSPDPITAFYLRNHSISTGILSI